MPHQNKHPLACLITGVGPRGAAKAIAEEFSRQGGKITIVGSQNDKDELEKVRS